MKKNTILIRCIGIDNRIHFCEPYLDKTICGIKVRRKKILSHDYERFYWCFECDCKGDDYE